MGSPSCSWSKAPQNDGVWVVENHKADQGSTESHPTGFWLRRVGRADRASSSQQTFLMTSIEFLASVPIVRSFLND